MHHYVIRAFDRYRKRGLFAVLIGIKNVIARRLIPIYPRCVFYWLVRGYILRQCDIGWCLHNIRSGDFLYMPDLATVRNHTPGRYDRIESIYYPNILDDLNSDDTVVDIGAYIGRSSILPAETGASVYAVEASPRNRQFLKRNVSDWSNINIVLYAVWEKSGKIDINIGTIAGDDGVLTPDSGPQGEPVSVQARTVADIADEYGIEVIDFLKVEAEGAEPEVIEGIGDVPVRRISCNCGPERDGETTHEKVATKLYNDGWKVTINTTDHPYPMVYAINPVLAESWDQG